MLRVCLCAAVIYVEEEDEYDASVPKTKAQILRERTAAEGGTATSESEGDASPRSSIVASIVLEPAPLRVMKKPAKGGQVKLAGSGTASPGSATR